MNRIENIKQQIQDPAKQGISNVLVNANLFDFKQVGSLKDLVVVMTGGSRGIALEIGKLAGKDGAKVAILAKTTEPHPKLPGTIYTAAKEIRKQGGECIPIKCDIRSEQDVKSAVQQVIEKFGKIDILINNAATLYINDIDSMTMKQYDLLYEIHSRGYFMMTKYCLPYLKKSKNPHILNMSPPISTNSKFFSQYLGYSISKFAPSMMVLGWAGEFREFNIGVNSLWPRTTILSGAPQHTVGEEKMLQRSRKVDIMADAAYIILTSDSKITTGNFFVDDEVLASVGIYDLSKYQVDQRINLKDLQPDLLI